MATTKINIGETVNSLEWISRVNSTINNVEEGIAVTRRRAEVPILETNEIGHRLRKVQSQISEIESKMQAIHQAIDQGAMQYRMAENIVVSIGKQIGNQLVGK